MLLAQSVPALPATSVAIKVKCKNQNTATQVKGGGLLHWTQAAAELEGGFRLTCLNPGSPRQRSRTRSTEVPPEADGYRLEMVAGRQGDGPKSKCTSEGTFTLGGAPVFNETCQVSAGLVRMRTL
jgi:hypothetical protein